MDLEHQKIYTSRDIVFHETTFPYAKSSTQPLFPPTNPSPVDLSHLQHNNLPATEPPCTASPETAQQTEATPPSVRRSTRLHRTPQYLADYMLAAQITPSCFTTLTNLSFQPPLMPVNCLHSASQQLLANLDFTEPQSYEEAALHPGWQKAMEQELQALHHTQTWTIVSLPPGKKPIACKWVYKIKTKADGSIERLKARLVVKGFTQKEGVDYVETYSPVIKLTTLRVLMTIAVKKGWILHQLDVNNAFLHGELHEEIYMQLPPGVHSPLPRAVCRLQKSLYGLKQASRQWYEKLSMVLLQRGYMHSENDYSLFCKKEGDLVVFLAVYVDDILLTGNNEAEISSLKSFLDCSFKIKDLGLAHYFLGIEILYTNDGLLLTQRKFTYDLLQDFDCSAAHTAVCPLDYTVKLQPDEGEPLADPSQYRRLIGKLNYLTHTRPDIAFSVQHLSQFLQLPRQPHMQAAFHVLQYLKNEPALGVMLNNSPTFDLLAYCDADWASCTHTRKSVSGFVIFLGNTLISWKSKKQTTVSLSSAEAEYRSLRRLTAELAWLSRLLTELTLTSVTPIPVRCDNLAAIYIARNPVFHERTKHIELDCHFVRQKLLEGLVSLSFTPTKHQLADICTKPLTGIQHRFILSKLGVSSPSNLRGGVNNAVMHDQPAPKLPCWHSSSAENAPGMSCWTYSSQGTSSAVQDEDEDFCHDSFNSKMGTMHCYSCHAPSKILHQN